MHEKIRHRLLGAWARLIARHPLWVMAVAVAATIGSVVITLGGLPTIGIAPLSFQSDRNALISEHLPWNRRFIRWTKNYKGTRDLTIVIDASPGSDMPDDAQLRRAESMVVELGAALRAERDDLERVDWGFSTKNINARAIRMLEMSQFDRQLQRIEAAAPLLTSTTLTQLIAAIKVQAFRGATQHGEAGAADAIDKMTALAEAISISLTAGSSDANPFSQMDAPRDRSDWQYLRSDNKRLLFVRITPRVEKERINALARAIGTSRTVVKRIAKKYPGIEAGLTGIEVVEADETEAAVRDSMYASIIAFVLIAVLLMTGFQSVRTPLLAMLSLVFAVAWSFGYLTIAIGHLQIISVVFTVILLGLGIAYGIHIVSRYELIRHSYSDDLTGFADSMTDVLVTMGPAIVTGALTTAAAFITTMFTDFRGVAEMGHVAAAGVVLCAIGMFSVFPALLRLTKSHHRHVRPMESRWFHFFEEKWVMPFARRPALTVAAAIMVSVVSLYGAFHMRFDYDLVALMPDGVDSVRWQQRVSKSGGRSIWSAMYIAKDLDEARAQTQKLRRIVASNPDSRLDPKVGGVGLLFPIDDAQKKEKIGVVRRRLDDARRAVQPATGLDGADLATEFKHLRALIKRFGTGLDSQPLRTALTNLDAAIGRAIGILDAIEPNERPRVLARLDRQFADYCAAVAQRVNDALDPSALTLDDLPPVMQRLYRGADGSVALEVYPKMPDDDAIDSPLHPRFLPRFIEDLRSIDGDSGAADRGVTGVIVQVYESGLLIKNAYIWAGVWAFVVVFVMVAIDFRSMADALLCLLPVAIGFAATFGIMYVSGMTINPANVIVLPLMFGIGVDAGVHILHRYRQDPRTRPLGLTAGTGKGITLTSFTAMIGFGTLMLASHRGIRSLGFVLATGIGLTMLACWLVMPACLELRRRITANS